MAKGYLRDPDSDEPKYNSEEDYKKATDSKMDLAQQWASKIEAAKRVKKKWSDRFRVEMLYQYYEGFQWWFEVDENNRPYVINMIYSTIETKLPNLIFDNPQFSLRARPVGLEFDEESANEATQVKEDALNYVCARSEFGISDKHELAVLDAFFGFGAIEAGCSKELHMNPNIPIKGKSDALDQVYCKQIPFDTFFVSAAANWDLSEGRWYGYYEFIPYTRLEKYKDKLNFEDKPYANADDSDYFVNMSGKIMVNPDYNPEIGPSGTCKIWKLWDFDTNKFCLFCPDHATNDANRILEYKDFEYSPVSIIRFGKRRKGWYPYPPVWNWISPQDELNDTRQAQRLHRKRFRRAYAVRENMIDPEEIDKFLYGPDGTLIVVKGNVNECIAPIQDAPMDPVSPQTLGVTYDDFNRISGTPDEQRAVPVSSNRTTATQASIMNQRSQIRDSKDSLRIADFLCSIARTTLKALRQVKKDFWYKSKLPAIADGPMMELKTAQYSWKQLNPSAALRDEDHDVDLTVTSVSPINAQQDKNSFMEFLAVLTQYEILAFSPALLKEAAYRMGYKNEAVLNQFQQMAQLASIGRLAQLKGQVAQSGMQPTAAPSTQMAQQQVDQSTPPDNQSIMNTIFNRGSQPQ